MRILDRLAYAGLLLLVLLAPLPLGSNREWSWSLAAVMSGALALLWALSRLRPVAPLRVRLHPLIPALFALACAWVVVQAATWAPVAWHHPLWPLTSEALQQDLPGRVSLAAEESWTALLRLLSYALVFLLALQFGAERRRAQAVFGWLTLAGLAYGMFGLAAYWGDYHAGWLFGERVLAPDVRGTFINRNHFATWQGLTILCAIAWFHQRMAKPEARPYALPQDREARVEAFILAAWKPLTGLLLMVAALILTHSRGGFVATLAGVIALLALLDRRARGGRASSRALVVSALAVAGIAFYLTSEVLLDRINRTDITTEERLAVFANVNRAIGDNPVLGFGYGTFADSFRLYDQNEAAVHYDRAHNTWLENAFELGLPAALALYLALGGLALTCWRGSCRRWRCRMRW
ncbi:MAG: O-antigen ligase family protein [Xanthomonadales bacterium]|nr:O-antigen ligase family protein [Xanthomonadales bacterium]